MSAGQTFQKFVPGDGIPAGVATIYRLLGKTNGNPPFGVGITEHKPGELDLHLNYDEGIYMLEGDLEIRTGDESYVLAPGEFLWMPRGVKITYVVKTAAKYLYITSPASPNS